MGSEHGAAKPASIRAQADASRKMRSRTAFYSCCCSRGYANPASGRQTKAGKRNTAKLPWRDFTFFRTVCAVPMKLLKTCVLVKINLQVFSIIFEAQTQKFLRAPSGQLVKSLDAPRIPALHNEQFDHL